MYSRSRGVKGQGAGVVRPVMVAIVRRSHCRPNGAQSRGRGREAPCWRRAPQRRCSCADADQKGRKMYVPAEPLSCQYWWMPRTGCGTTSTCPSRCGARPAWPWDASRRRSRWPWSRPRIRRISGRPQGVFPRHGGEGEGRRAEPRSHALGDAPGCRAEATSKDGQRRRIAPAADTAMGLTRGSAAVIEENFVRTEAGRKFSPIRGTTRHPMLGLSEQSSHSRTAYCSPAVSRVRNRRVAACASRHSPGRYPGLPTDAAHLSDGMGEAAIRGGEGESGRVQSRTDHLGLAPSGRRPCRRPRLLGAPGGSVRDRASLELLVGWRNHR